MNKLKLFAPLLLVASFSTLADIAVVVHPSNDSAVDQDMIKRIFLGKAKSFANGNTVAPYNQSSGSAVADEFSEKVLSKSSSQIKAYWSKLVFTGKGTPPKEVGSDSEVLKTVAADANAIGYVDASAVDSSVKVVGKF